MLAGDPVPRAGRGRHFQRVHGAVVHAGQPAVGTQRAAGIAIVSTVGGSAGMVAPVAVGAIKAATGGFTLSLLLLSSATVLAALIFVLYFRPGRPAMSGPRRAETA